MDSCFSPHSHPSVLESLPSSVKNLNSISSFSSPFRFSFRSRDSLRSVRSANPRAAVVAAADRHGDFNSLNTPLEPKSSAGKYLSSVLQNDRRCFHEAAAEQLQQLVADRQEAMARRSLSVDSGEACLHRRIAELKDRECQIAVEDVMYMLVFYKFSEIRVHLIPELSKCIYNGRLEILPYKDWELESIHSFEVLEMIRDHLTAVIGWRADSSVTENWATTNINRLQICKIYTASIFYGYFLKSATLRHQLETSLPDESGHLLLRTGTHPPLSNACNYRKSSVSFESISKPTSVGRERRKREKLGTYLMGFDPQALESCARPKSMEAQDLIEKHSLALFGAEQMGDEVISTSMASLKRFVLEAVAFGSFLWDTEEYVRTVYDLEENYP